MAAVSVAIVATPAATAHAAVYWTNFINTAGTTIGRAESDGTGANQSFITGASAPAGIASDGTYIYWANQSADTIGRATVAGTGVNQSFITGAHGPGGVAVRDGYIYWTNTEAGNYSIGRATVAGTGVNQSFIATSALPTDVAVDSAHIYWTLMAGGGADTVARADINGANKDESFIQSADQPRGVAVDAQHIYWSNSTTIGRADLDGSNVNEDFIFGIQTPRRLALDGAHIIWASPALGSIARANLDGASKDETWITGASGPVGVAIDPTANSKTPSATSVSCDYIVATMSDTCHATVASATRPTGPVAFSSPNGGTFTLLPGCFLNATPGSPDVGSCKLDGFIPPVDKITTIRADYAGDASHAPSTGTSEPLRPLAGDVFADQTGAPGSQGTISHPGIDINVQSPQDDSLVEAEICMQSWGGGGKDACAQTMQTAMKTFGDGGHDFAAETATPTTVGMNTWGGSGKDFAKPLLAAASKKKPPLATSRARRKHVHAGKVRLHFKLNKKRLLAAGRHAHNKLRLDVVLHLRLHNGRNLVVAHAYRLKLRKH